MNLNHPMHFYSGNATRNILDTQYPTLHAVTDEASLRQAVTHDYVCARYRVGHRSIGDFLVSDCLGMDLDNDHSENPADWVTPATVQQIFPGVEFAVHYSRHHNREKDGRPARPKFHVFFPVDEIRDAAAYSALKRRLAEVWPVFDPNALDAARCFFCTDDPVVEIYPGEKKITEALKELSAGARSAAAGPSSLPAPAAPVPQPSAPASLALVPYREGERNTGLHREAVILLKRYGDSDRARSGFEAAAARCTPPLSGEELNGIWTSARKFYRGTITQSPDYVPPEEYGKPNWEQPIPFDAWNPPVFPVDALPPVLAAQVSAVAESTQTPVDMAAACALAITATCMQGKFRIQGKPDWIEPENLFVLVIMPPSERKSAVEREFTRPLDVYEDEYNLAHQADVIASESRRRVLEKRQKFMEEQQAKGSGNEDEVRSLTEELASFRPVLPLHLYADDVTSEKLVRVMADNDGRAAILSAEGGIFDILSGAYSGKVNIDAFLKGYSGDSIRVDRISRASESIPHPVLTMLLMAQPSVLEGVIQNRTFCGRGLTARFLYCVPKSRVGSRRFCSTPVPPEVRAAYESRMRNLLEDPYTETPELIRLSPEASALLERYFDEHETQSKNEDDFDAWNGKLLGNILRIAGLLCRVSIDRRHGSFDVNDPLVVDEAVMASAIRIGDYFIAHAQGAFNLMGTDSTVNQSKYILSALIQNGVREFDRREIMHLCRRFKKAEEVQPCLDLLEDYRYIVPLTPENGKKTGRPALKKYICNPSIFEVA